MLVKFQSSTDGSILMFADAASALLVCLGKTPAERGVMAEEELGNLVVVLRALRDGSPAGVMLEGDLHATGRQKAEQGATATAPLEREVPVSLRQRATPLLELMQRTLDNEGYLLWEAPKGFGAAEQAQ